MTDQEKKREADLKFKSERLWEDVKNREAYISHLELQIIQKENHIQNIQPGYEDWQRFNARRTVKLANRIRYAAKNAACKIKQYSGKEKMCLPDQEAPLVSILISADHESACSCECIKSVLNHTAEISYEIILLRGISTVSAGRMRRHIKGIRVLESSGSRGNSGTYNDAASVALGEYLVILDDRSMVTEKWLEHLLELMKSDRSIGIAGAKAVYGNGQIRTAGGIVFSDGSVCDYGEGMDAGCAECNYVKETDFVSGGAVVITASLWKEIGGFDTGFYSPDYRYADLAFRVAEHGLRAVYQPKSVTVSDGHENSSDQEEAEKDRRKFRERWKKRLSVQSSPDRTEIFAARDHSRHKKTVLIIDRFVPRFDQDAGSRTTGFYIQLFLKMGYNVKFLGDDFCRQEPYTSFFQQMGVEILYAEWKHLKWNAWISENGRFLDVVFLNRPNITIKYIDELREMTDAKLLYYGHDLHYIRELRGCEIEGNTEKLQIIENLKNTEYEVMRMSDAVYYPSSAEIEIIRREEPDVPARAIPAYIYEKPCGSETLPVGERKDLMFIGGFEHKPNEDAVLWFAEEIFPVIREALPEIRFYVLGLNPTRAILDLASEQVIVKGYVSDDELKEIYQKCRMDIVPLRYGAGVKGKVVEGIYNRIPIVTTSIGAEGLPQSGDVLAVADDAQSFAEKVISLYRDESALNKMIDHCDSYIEKHFSVQAAMDILKKDL